MKFTFFYFSAILLGLHFIPFVYFQWFLYHKSVKFSEKVNIQHLCHTLTYTEYINIYIFTIYIMYIYVYIYVYI